MGGVLAMAAFWQNYLIDISQQKTLVQKENTPFFSPLQKTKKKKSRIYFSRFDNSQKLKIKKNHQKKEKHSSEKTIFIIAPHPDDEILCCSNMIDQKIKQKENIKIIFLTNGDGLTDATPLEAQEYGRIRRKESRTAARFLGLDSSDLFFLNFPDRYLTNLENISPLQSIYTQQNKSSWDSAFPHTYYTRRNLKKNLISLFRRFEPDEIYIPSQNDYHPDHQVASHIIQEILAEMMISPEISEYTVHGKILRKHSENSGKLRLIRIFRSQFHDTFHRNFLEQFAYAPEEFIQWEPINSVKH
jgi:LmbE family N-acetylglucosaminyl deacetylase